MVTDFPEKVDNGTVVNPVTTKLFQVNNNSTKLDKKKAKQFHTFVAKGLFYQNKLVQISILPYLFCVLVSSHPQTKIGAS